MSNASSLHPPGRFCLLLNVTQWVTSREMAELLADRLKRWRGPLRQKEAAAKLDIPLPTYRKYENGKRTPAKLALVELERRMNQIQ